MGNYWWCAFLFRVALPFSTAIAGFMRPTITSYIYMLLGFYSPFFSVPTNKTMAGSTGIFMKIVVVTTMLTMSLVTSFYFALFFPSEREFDIGPCTTLEKAIRTVGVVDFRELSFANAIPWCLPEPLMLIASLLLYFGFKRLCQDTDVIRATKEMEGTELAKQINRKKILEMMLNTGKYLVLLMLCCTSVLKATVFGALYYFLFLSTMMYWACNRPLGRGYARALVCLIPFMFVHMSIMFCYQFQYMQDSLLFDSKSLLGRLFNLVDIKTYKDCTDPRIFKFHAQSGSIYAAPICLFLLYHVAILVAREMLEADDGINNLLIALFRKSSTTPPRQKWKKAFEKVQKNLENEKLAATGDGSFTADQIKNVVNQVLHFIMSISYLTANFIMMIWSIAYVGWKTLILLIWANLIWLMPFRKKVMLVTSPLLVFWISFLLATNYLYALDLTREELPSGIGGLRIDPRIKKKGSLMWLHMLTKSLFGVIIFVTMRQLWHDRATKKQQKRLIEAAGLSGSEAVMDFDDLKENSDFLENFKATGLRFIATWWIWVVIVTMIWMDFWTTSNLFRIAFVGLALLFIFSFQVCPFNLWKKFLRLYWWVVIVYAMLNLFIVYMYQMHWTRALLHRVVAEERFLQYGFKQWTDPKELFLALANPLFFQIAVVVQQYYLHNEFDKLTSPLTSEELEEEKKKMAGHGPKWRAVKNFSHNAVDVLFKVLEVHIQNIILLIGWYMCIFDLCALFVPFVLLFTVSCVFGRTVTNIIVNLVSFFVQVLIMLRLVYMNLYTRHDSWNFVGHYERNGKMFRKTLNSADWLGFHESRYGREYADFWQLSWCFFYVFAVTLLRIVIIRMKNYRLARNLPVLQRRLLFPEITFENCHENTHSLLKFLANYGFFKFGCEITIVFAAMLMGLRMDAVAIMVSFWLLMIFALNRKWMRIAWLPSLIFVAIAVPLQYLATLGFWPSYWNNSGTRFWSSNDFLLHIQQFCHFSNMAHPPIKAKISLDFWMLLLLSRQWRAFRREYTLRGQYSLAGSNVNVASLVDDKNLKNPVPDFVTHTRSYLDVFKRIFFTMWFYLALGSTFLAATMRPTLYSFGYIICAFLFVWEGTDLYLRPPKRIMLRWNFLIGYNILVMMIRCISQIFGCILEYQVTLNCAALKTFSVGCIDKFQTMRGVPNVLEPASCDVDFTSLGLGYDCLCFFFLVFQQRIFKSYHFFHLVNDCKAQTILADRGARFIESKRYEKRRALDAQDATIRDNIKKKMDKIRATHVKVQGEVYNRRKKNHKHILKSSDYYVFDDAILKDDIPLLPPKIEEIDNEVDHYDPMTLSEYFGLLHASNIETVLAERKLRRQQKNAIQEGKRPEDIKKTLPSKAGGSKDPETPPAETKTKKVLKIVVFVWGAFESSIVSITGVINYFTKIFRQILNEMNKERKILKRKTKYSEGVRLGTNQVWHPTHSYSDILNAAKGSKDEDEDFSMQYSIYAKLLRAIWYSLWGNSEWLCYLIIIVNQVLKANLISLPLVVMMFCWGALSAPRPTKTFWVISIAYVIINLFISNFFVNNLIPWNTNLDFFQTNLFFPPTVIGLTNTSTIACDLMMLVALFFHRIVLNMMGLWKPYSYRRAALMDDGDYTFKDGQFVMTKGKGPQQQQQQQLLTVKSVNVAMGDYFPKSIVHGSRKYAEGMRLFMQQLIFPSSTQLPVDVYTVMFLCDLIDLFLLMFYFGSFESENEGQGFIEFIKFNRVPVSFLTIVLTYFLLMVIDRAIYLRKNRFAKMIYYVFQVMFYHIWFFILYPLITNRNFCDTPVAQTFYIFKCLYFLLSAYQIRNGYPPLISSHYLWHGTTIFNRFGYKFYRLIPYFFEMRTLLDWICSDSCLGVNNWLKMEEITQNIFDQKCEQDFEETWSLPSGKPKSRTVKYVFGGFLYVLLILTVIFPFLLFSLGSTVGVRTHPAKIKIELYMGSAEPIFKSYANVQNLQMLSAEEYKNLTTTFNNIDKSESIFGSFEPQDVVVVSWSPNSLTKWRISPGTLKEMMVDLYSDEPFAFRMEIHYTHIGHGGQKESRTFGQTTMIPPLPNLQRKNLISILESDKALDTVIWLPLLFPKFLLLTQESIPEALSIMEEPVKTVDYREYLYTNKQDDDDDDADVEANPTILRNLLLSLKISDDGEMWWHVQEECAVDDDNYFYYLKNLIYNECDSLVMYTFNEKVFSDAMNYMTQSGILGLYLVYFMMVIGIIRSCRIEIDEIWIEDLPDSDYMMRKCMEVYIARDYQNYELEEELFAELIFIMRSREILIKLTRYKDSPYNPPLLDAGSNRKSK